MSQAVEVLEVWRGPIRESVIRGHAVVCTLSGDVVDAWGDADLVTLPRSSCKMIQALPLVLSGAADAQGLTPEHLALACASHQGAPAHTDRVSAWLDHLGLAEPDLRCGPQEPSDKPVRDALIRAGDAPCRIHNNCSGKHAGFLTLNQHLGGGADYHHPDHPVQVAVKEQFETATGEVSPGFGIDGCSAPNHACTLTGLARAMAAFAGARDDTATGAAMTRLREAMIAHPYLVAGDNRACTALMQAAPGVAVKTGAEGVFVGILRDAGLGIALKIESGAASGADMRGADAFIAWLLVKYGALDSNHPAAQTYMRGPITNWDGLITGEFRPGQGL